jgi:bifunctional non-homologous end joining protein LigD
VSPEPERVTVTVEGRQLRLSNLDKVLYPEAGFTKGQMLDYYTRISPVLLPHLRGRPLTVKRYPDGVDAHFFFEKNVPRHAPDWVRRVDLPTPGSTRGRARTEFAIVSDLPTLVWAANLATVELHVPMWRVDARGKPQPPDLMVYDLDPGPPATIVECCEVGLLLRAALAADKLAAHPKTSGSKGLQLYVPLAGKQPWEDVHVYARELAERLAGERPDLVVSNMSKQLRGGKVLVDWSQNNAAKTTVAVYSLRARPRPTASTPVDWDEVTACADAADPDLLRFEAADVLERVDSRGDLFAPLLEDGGRLPG